MGQGKTISKSKIGDGQNFYNSWKVSYNFFALKEQ